MSSGKFLGHPADDDEVVPRFDFGMQTAPEDIAEATLEIVLEDMKRQANMKAEKTSDTIPALLSYVQEHANDDFLLDARATGIKNPFKKPKKKCSIS